MNTITRKERIAAGTRTLATRFLDDRCTTYAAALSFSSLLSIVPFFALVFAVLKAMDIHSSLATTILGNVTAGSHELVTRILRYINNTKVGSLGAVGLATLFLSVMATLDTLEDAFNQICGLDRGKKYHHKLRDYLIVILSIPLLLALAASITTSLQHQAVVQWFFRLPLLGTLLLALFRMTPYLSIWSALVLVYKFIPNTRVSLANALKGALLAGTLVQIAQWCYIHFQFGVSRYNAIYGTMALLPVFMIWLYTCWVVVLAGMELVWMLQAPPPADNTHVQDSQPALTP